MIIEIATSPESNLSFYRIGYEHGVLKAGSLSGS